MTNKKYNKIGIICAMSIEIDGIAAAIENPQTKTVAGIDFISGKIGEKEVVVAKCGIGKVFAALCTQAMICTYSPDCIINTGVAGGLAEGLSILDAVVATDMVQHDMNTSAIGDPVGLISGINIVNIPTDEHTLACLEKSLDALGVHHISGTVASGDLFVAENKHKDYIRKHFDAVACEMEGGAVGHVCYVNRIPFGVLRSISDGGDNAASMDYPTFAAKAAKISIAATLEFLKIV